MWSTYSSTALQFRGGVSFYWLEWNCRSRKQESVWLCLRKRANTETNAKKAAGLKHASEIARYTPKPKKRKKPKNRKKSEKHPRHEEARNGSEIQDRRKAWNGPRHEEAQETQEAHHWQEKWEIQKLTISSKTTVAIVLVRQRNSGLGLGLKARAKVLLLCPDVCGPSWKRSPTISVVCVRGCKICQQ